MKAIGSLELCIRRRSRLQRIQVNRTGVQYVEANKDTFIVRHPQANIRAEVFVAGYALQEQGGGPVGLLLYVYRILKIAINRPLIRASFVQRRLFGLSILFTAMIIKAALCISIAMINIRQLR